MATRKLLQPILIGGLIAGVLDITYAFIFSYIRSGRLLHMFCNPLRAVRWDATRFKVEKRPRRWVSDFISSSL